MNKSTKETIQQILEEIDFARKDIDRFRKEVERLKDVKHGIYEMVAKESDKWPTEIR